MIPKTGSTVCLRRAYFALPAAVRNRWLIFSFVVASPRLDCVTAALVGYSREKSGAAIKAGLVTQNYQVAMSTSQKVDVGDKISIRGKGKFVLDRIGPMTKKGRLSIFGRKYK